MICSRIFLLIVLTVLGRLALATKPHGDTRPPAFSRMKNPIPVADDRVVPVIKIMYSGFINRGYNHLFELGYYHMFDFTGLSYGPSVSLLTKLHKGRLVVGPKIGLEANLLLFDAKLDVSYLHPGVYIHPSAGLSILGNLGILIGGNLCVNRPRDSGITFGAYFNLPMKERKNGAGNLL